MISPWTKQKISLLLNESNKGELELTDFHIRKTLMYNFLERVFRILSPKYTIPISLILFIVIGCVSDVGFKEFTLLMLPTLSVLSIFYLTYHTCRSFIKYEVIIFDDLERCGIETQTLLGLIDGYTHTTYRIIVIANDKRAL